MLNRKQEEMFTSLDNTSSEKPLRQAMKMMQGRLANATAKMNEDAHSASRMMQQKIEYKRRVLRCL